MTSFLYLFPRFQSLGYFALLHHILPSFLDYYASFFPPCASWISYFFLTLTREEELRGSGAVSVRGARADVVGSYERSGSGP